MWNFKETELRAALNMLGVHGTSSWPKQRAVSRLEALGIKEGHIKNLLREQREKDMQSKARSFKQQYGGGGYTRNKFFQGRPVSWAEYEFLRASGVHFDEAYIDDDDDEAEFVYEVYETWKRGPQGRSPPKDRDFQDDYREYTMDEDEWEDWDWDDEDFAAGKKQGKRRGRSYSSYDFDPYEENPFAQGFRTYSVPNYGQPGPASSAPPTWGVGPSGSYQPRAPPLNPEEAMKTALKDGWKKERLSRPQASMLLGVSPNPTSGEVAKARRQLVLKWHPDRNPGDPNANTAMQLVLAAAELLGL